MNFLINTSLSGLFALASALATVLIWTLFSFFTPEPLAIDQLGFSSMMAGLLGPMLIIWLVYKMTEKTENQRQRPLRRSCVIGAAIILVVLAAYLIPLGLLHLAYQGVRM